MAKLSDVHHDKRIDVEPCVLNGIHARPLINERIVLDADQGKALIDYFIATDQQRIIEKSLQGLCERADGTQLLSAFPSISEFKHAVSSLDKNMFAELFASLPPWELAGCSEIMLHFEQVIDSAQQ